MVSARLFALLSIAYLSSVAVAKPYAPDLYSRAELAESSNDGEKMMKRAIAGFQPYAPQLFSRSEVEEMPTARRSPSPAVEASSWSPLEFLGLRAFSEEEMHARGKVADSVIEKRGHCSSDSACGNDHYCSTKRHQCYKKLDNGLHCSRNGACGSGYCCETDDTCKPKRDIGSRCHQNDGACYSGYCSVKTNNCKAPAGPSGSCLVDAGCSKGLSCVNGSCKKIEPSHPGKGPHKTHPHGPSPSGSHKNPRSLTHL